MEYIASISYGKDSIAMLEVIARHNMPINRIAHVELMATADISADLPEVAEWKQYADKVILERYGLHVEHHKPAKTFEEMFYEIPENRLRTWKQRREGIDPFKGKIRGFPMFKGKWCSKALKIRTLNDVYKKADSVQYIGIAADEQKRHGQLNDKVRSPLAEWGITEIMAKQMCRDIGLLAPTYIQSRRTGCWYCPFQPLENLRLLRNDHPELWKILLEWDKNSPVPFRYHGKRETVKDIDERFENEEKQICLFGRGGGETPASPT